MSEDKFSLSKLFDKIKIGVLGTKTSALDKEIDTSLHNIVGVSSQTASNKYLESLKNLVGTTGADFQKDVLQSSGAPIVSGTQAAQSLDSTGRIRRYDEYDAVVSKISYLQRAIKVLTDNIISPDEITKRSIQFVDETLDKDISNKDILARLKKIEKSINFENKIENIISTTLKKGDYFTEVIYSPKGQNAFSIINENLNRVPSKDWNEIVSESSSFSIGLAEKNSTPQEKSITIKIHYDTKTPSCEYLTESQTDKNEEKVLTEDILPEYKADDLRFQKDHSNDIVGDEQFRSRVDADMGPNHTPKDSVLLSDIFLTTHNPKYIIRLETERFRTCLGFLVFPKIDIPSLTTSMFSSSSTNSVDSICQSILNKLHLKLTNQSESDSIPMSEDLRNTVINYLYSLKTNADLHIRYVPVEMMIHWRISVDKFDPYGESVLENVMFDCKLLLALKTATTIKRLTSSVDKRIIKVETGLPRDAKNLIESLKETMRKRKISIGSMGSIDSIPDMIHTFEDIYVPTREGKEYVSFDHQQFGPAPQPDIEDMKFIRDGIVANLSIPAPFLGLEENTSNRALLTVENILFCRTIISHQKVFSVPLKELFKKIYSLAWPDNKSDLDDYKITFPEPKISPYEHEMEYVENMQRLIEAYAQLGIPRDWLAKRYLPTLDWKDIEKSKTEESINQNMSLTKTDDVLGQGGMTSMGAPFGSPTGGF